MSSAVTSTFNYCTPTASATYTTTVYETVLPAACETGIWEATYTITDYCHGSCDGYVHPAFPPGFTVSTVHCPVCPTPEVVITCPTVVPAKPTGGLPYPVVVGNGVTAVCEKCEGGNNGGYNSGYNNGGHSSAYNSGYNNGTPTITVYGNECTSGCNSVTTYPPGIVSPAPPPPVMSGSPAPPPNNGGYPVPPPANSGYPVPPPANGGGNGPVKPPANSGYPVAPPAAPPANGGYPAAPPANGGYPAAPPANGGYPAAPPANGGYPAAPPATGGVITKPSSPYQTNPPVVVAGATSVSRSLGLISGLAAIAGYVYLL